MELALPGRKVGGGGEEEETARGVQVHRESWPWKESCALLAVPVCASACKSTLLAHLLLVRLPPPTDTSAKFLLTSANLLLLIPAVQVETRATGVEREVAEGRTIEHLGTTVRQGPGSW